MSHQLCQSNDYARFIQNSIPVMIATKELDIGRYSVQVF
jgi:hypothetical protein